MRALLFGAGENARRFLRCHYYDSVVVIEKKHRGYSFFTELGQ